ncbi:hypothetical protein [Actinomadura oligospora]|uniref:hypothetical protein n=1 Tax=Actinomadura oligospora TaxID=111804 RepID=UPI00047D307B|nr:hypothetical protein [Actinomadura oligospora]
MPSPDRLVDDVDGLDLKPDPLTAATFTELEDLMRQFWRWAGSPSCRDVARDSNGAFSHGTVSKLLYDRADKPVLKLTYLRGCIRGCGAGEQEERRWTTAWRRIHMAPPADEDGCA